MDLRDLDAIGHPNIKFLQANLMLRKPEQFGIADSISCLYALGHFGLGRYGDPIDPQGHRKGFNNIVYMLKPGGRFYVSFPIGKKTEVHFNAHRVFHPYEVLKWAAECNGLALERFDYADDSGILHLDVELLDSNLNVNYGCGIYIFVKQHQVNPC